MKTLITILLIAHVALLQSLSGQTYSSGQIPFNQADSGGQLRGKRLPTDAGAFRDALMGPYAVIFIPLPPGSQWTDFELKASIDNFNDDGSGMVFFYHSPAPLKIHFAHHVWTNAPDVYYTSSGRTGTPNRRTWLKQGSTSIFAALEDASSEVGGFVVIVKDDLREHRDKLVWSYSLMDGTSTDDDPANRSVWRPVWPIDWVHDFNPNP